MKRAEQAAIEREKDIAIAFAKGYCQGKNETAQECLRLAS